MARETTVVHFDPEFGERALCAADGFVVLTSDRSLVTCDHCEEVAVAREDRAVARWEAHQIDDNVALAGCSCGYTNIVHARGQNGCRFLGGYDWQVDPLGCNGPLED
jgi:hypothetical protein